jgi:hypothetical protein
VTVSDRVHIFPFNPYAVMITNVDLSTPRYSPSVYTSMKITVGKFYIILPYRYCILICMIILGHGYWSNKFLIKTRFNKRVGLLFLVLIKEYEYLTAHVGYVYLPMQQCNMASKIAFMEVTPQRI